MLRKNTLQETLAAGLAALITAAGAASLSLSFVSFEWARKQADRFATDGRADLFTEPAFHAIGLRLQIVAAILLALGGFSWWMRKNLAAFLDELSRSFSSVAQDAKGRFKASLETSGNLHLSALGGICLAGILLRIYFLFQPFRCDEAFSFTNYVSKPLYIGLSNYSEPNNHLFHTLLSHLSFLVFGDTPWALRLPAFFAGILLIPAAYLVIRLLYGKEAALLGTALCASSVELIKYSTNARGYSLIGLFSLSLLCLGIYLRENPKSLASWFLFSLCSALGLYTIPTMILPLGGIGLWLLSESLFFESRKKKKEFFGGLFLSSIAAGILALFLYIPPFIAVSPQKVLANPWVSSAGWEKFSEGFPHYAWATWMQWNREIPPPLAWVLSLGALLSTGLHWRMGKGKIPIAFPLLLWGCLFAAGRMVVPSARSWLYLAPLYYGLGAAGLLFFARRALRGSEAALGNAAVATALLLTIWLGGKATLTGAVYRSDETGEAVDGQAIARYLAPKIREGDAIVGGGLTPPTLRYYFQKEKLETDPFTGDPRVSRRLFVIVPTGIDPRKTLLDLGISAGKTRLLEKFDRFRASEIYETAPE